MSTKKIREALTLLGKFIEDAGPCDHAVGICQHGERQLLSDATEELEAIEQPAATRSVLAEAIAEGDTAALERLAQMACDERNARIAKESK